ncbi:MAG: ketopantoate reductase family protein [Candidatus Marsarchaeota archaeon]|nr:ketopantoate reductase family protein [Candidatus Marsarchaeota archaeon]
MRVAIIGAGSLGSVFGGMLALGGSEVFLISRHTEYIDQVNLNGLRLIEESGERITWPRAIKDPGSVGSVDLLIVLVKSFDTREAMTSASSLVGEETTVLSLQNGLGNEEVLADLFGWPRILYGRTFIGGDSVAPGRVVTGLRDKLTIIGEIDGRPSSRVAKISHLFNSSGLLTEVSDNVLGVVWNKLLVNISTGALAGVTGLPYGRLYDVPELLGTAITAVNEGIAVAKALGVQLLDEDAEAIWLSAGRGQPASFRTSILQSLDRGSKTEIDFINGAVVRLGKEVGLSTPVNQALVACVKGLEYRNVVDKSG